MEIRTEDRSEGLTLCWTWKGISFDVRIDHEDGCLVCTGKPGWSMGITRDDLSYIAQVSSAVFGLDEVYRIRLGG